MAKQNLNVGSSANDGTGDTLRDGAIKLNSVIDELYTNLGNDTNLQVNIGAPVNDQVLRWTGTAFTEAHLDSLSADLNVKAYKIISENNENIVIEPNGTGDLQFKAGSQGAAKVYIDGADGYLKWEAAYPLLTDLPDAAAHHGMFAHVHDTGKGYFAHGGNWISLLDANDGISILTDVDTTVNGGPSDGQVLKWNDTSSKWEPANDESATGGGGGTTQNLFETITGDTGTTTASAANDTLNIVGGTNISTALVGDTLTITMTGALGDPDQNLFETFGADNGSTTATVTTDSLNFLGGSGISTNLNAGAITITNDSPNIVQNVLQSVSGDSGSYTAVAANSGITIAGGTGITTAVSANTLTITNTASFPSANENDNLVYDGSQFIATESPTISFRITSDLSNGYRFDGGGAPSNTNNPTIYVYRGFTYRFNNTTGGGHPFALRQSNGGSPVTDGVSGSQSGIQFWTVPQTLSAGTTYVYQCTIHGGMVGNLVVV